MPRREVQRVSTDARVPPVVSVTLLCLPVILIVLALLRDCMPRVASGEGRASHSRSMRPGRESPLIQCSGSATRSPRCSTYRRPPYSVGARSSPPNSPLDALPPARPGRKAPSFINTCGGRRDMEEKSRHSLRSCDLDDQASQIQGLAPIQAHSGRLKSAEQTRSSRWPVKGTRCAQRRDARAAAVFRRRASETRTVVVATHSLRSLFPGGTARRMQKVSRS